MIIADHEGKVLILRLYPDKGWRAQDMSVPYL